MLSREMRPLDLAAPIVACLLGCLDPTEVTVQVTTDLPCAQLKGTTIRVGPSPVDKLAPSASQPSCDSEGHIGTVVILPNESRGSAVLQVTTGVGESPEACVVDGYKGGCVVARRAISFVPHTRLTLPVVMQNGCLNVPCDESSTCINGACQLIEHLDLDAGAPPDASPPVDASAPDAKPTTGVSFVSSLNAQGSGSTTLAVPLPPQGKPGDTLIVALTTTNAGLIYPTEPDNTWAPIANANNNTLLIGVHRHTLTSSEPASYAFGVSSTQSLAAIAAIYRGVTANGNVLATYVQPQPYTMESIPGAPAGAIYAAFFGVQKPASWTAQAPAVGRSTTPFPMFLADQPVLVAGPTGTLATLATPTPPSVPIGVGLLLVP